MASPLSGFIHFKLRESLEYACKSLESSYLIFSWLFACVCKHTLCPNILHWTLVKHVFAFVTVVFVLAEVLFIQVSHVMPSKDRVWRNRKKEANKCYYSANKDTIPLDRKENITRKKDLSVTMESIIEMSCNRQQKAPKYIITKWVLS